MSRNIDTAMSDQAAMINRCIVKRQKMFEHMGKPPVAQLLNNTCIACSDRASIQPLDAHGADDDQRQCFAKIIADRPVADFDMATNKISPPWKRTSTQKMLCHHAYNETVMSLMLHRPTAFAYNLMVDINQKYYVNDDPCRITHYCITEGVGYCDQCFAKNHDGGIYHRHKSVNVDDIVPICEICCIDGLTMHAMWFCPQCDLRMCQICAITNHAKQGPNESIMSSHDVHIMTLQERNDYYQEVWAIFQQQQQQQATALGNATDGEEEEASEPEVDDHGDGGWDYEESHASDNGPEVSDDQSDVDEGSESGFTLELPPQSSDTSTETMTTLGQLYPSGDITNAQVKTTFWKHYTAYRSIKGITTMRKNIWYKKHAPIHLVYVTVMAKGGFSVIHKKQWLEIYLKVNGLTYDPKTHRNGWKAARDLYEERLQAFESFMRDLGATFEDPLMLTSSE